MPARKSETISQRIKLARERAQLEPAELRNRLRKKGIELSKTGLHRLETTEPRNPNLKQIQAIAEITNASPSWILFGQGPAIEQNQVGDAIRSRVIDTIELMSDALDMNKSQAKTLKDLLKSMRQTKPARIRKP